MKMYIFKNLRKVSDRHHKGGGLVIIADNRTHAKELIKNEKNVFVNRKEWKEVREYDIKGLHHPTIIVFPDSGCC